MISWNCCLLLLFGDNWVNILDTGAHRQVRQQCQQSTLEKHAKSYSIAVTKFKPKASRLILLWIEPHQSCDLHLGGVGAFSHKEYRR